ncbi:hypothetical protein GH714_006209 [Hevea brasiliensis]|uniref:Protein kinase domain-containing protein n=1 Tax=Hevea brasiliensis TaxID=3981 RepID=A0A6A6MCR9_HEVBR|nr:hypothetical protein GH714_006209 [Hevea brasiliensis]
MLPVDQQKDATNHSLQRHRFGISMLPLGMQWKSDVMSALRINSHFYSFHFNNLQEMATPVEPPNGVRIQGKHYYSMWQTCLRLTQNMCPSSQLAEELMELCAPRRSFKDVYLVYELMDTDLHQIIKSSQALTNDSLPILPIPGWNLGVNNLGDEIQISYNTARARGHLLRGLKYLHSASILHRDLKPGNLLINANCDLKICDFGLARASNGKGQFMTEYVVTRWYRAPELLLCCDNYGTSIDVWSVGCIFAELWPETYLPGTECLNQLKLIINILGSQGEVDVEFIDNPKAKRYIKSLPYSPGTPFSRLYPNAHHLAIDLLGKMLVFDPSKRIMLLKHSNTLTCPTL